MKKFLTFRQPKGYSCEDSPSRWIATVYACESDDGDDLVLLLFLLLRLSVLRQTPGPKTQRQRGHFEKSANGHAEAKADAGRQRGNHHHRPNGER